MVRVYITASRVPYRTLALLTLFLKPLLQNLHAYGSFDLSSTAAFSSTSSSSSSPSSGSGIGSMSSSDLRNELGDTTATHEQRHATRTIFGSRQNKTTYVSFWASSAVCSARWFRRHIRKCVSCSSVHTSARNAIPPQTASTFKNTKLPSAAKRFLHFEHWMGDSGCRVTFLMTAARVMTWFKVDNQ